MMPAWLKRFLNNQRTKTLHRRLYLRPATTHQISYGKIYGYEYTPSTNNYKHSRTHRSVPSKTIQKAKSKDYLYHHDHYYEGSSTCGGTGTACGGETWGGCESHGGGDSSCNGGDGDGGGGSSCGGGSCGGGGGD